MKYLTHFAIIELWDIRFEVEFDAIFCSFQRCAKNDQNDQNNVREGSRDINYFTTWLNAFLGYRSFDVW